MLDKILTESRYDNNRISRQVVKTYEFDVRRSIALYYTYNRRIMENKRNNIYCESDYEVENIASLVSSLFSENKIKPYELMYRYKKTILQNSTLDEKIMRRDIENTPIFSFELAYTTALLLDFITN